MKEKNFFIVLAVVALIAMGGLFLLGYKSKICPASQPCPDYVAKPARTDTIYRTQIQYIKEKHHEENPYVQHSVTPVAIFDSITANYGI